jgi:XapX domain-containing protein
VSALKAIPVAFLAGILIGALLSWLELPSPAPPTVVGLLSGSCAFAGIYLGYWAVTHLG